MNIFSPSSGSVFFRKVYLKKDAECVLVFDWLKNLPPRGVKIQYVSLERFLFRAFHFIKMRKETTFI